MSGMSYERWFALDYRGIRYWVRAWDEKSAQEEWYAYMRDPIAHADSVKLRLPGDLEDPLPPVNSRTIGNAKGSKWGKMEDSGDARLAMASSLQPGDWVGVAQDPVGQYITPNKGVIKRLYTDIYDNPSAIIQWFWPDGEMGREDAKMLKELVPLNYQTTLEDEDRIRRRERFEKWKQDNRSSLTANAQNGSQEISNDRLEKIAAPAVAEPPAIAPPQFDFNNWEVLDNDPDQGQWIGWYGGHGHPNGAKPPLTSPIGSWRAAQGWVIQLWEDGARDESRPFYKFYADLARNATPDQEHQWRCSDYPQALEPNETFTRGIDVFFGIRKVEKTAKISATTLYRVAPSSKRDEIHAKGFQPTSDMSGPWAWNTQYTDMFREPTDWRTHPEQMFSLTPGHENYDHDATLETQGQDKVYMFNSLDAARVFANKYRSLYHPSDIWQVRLPSDDMKLWRDPRDFNLGYDTKHPGALFGTDPIPPENVTLVESIDPQGHMLPDGNKAYIEPLSKTADQQSLFNVEPSATDDTGFSHPESKYGAFMGTHLDAIAQIGQHIDAIQSAAHEDIEKTGGKGFIFRQKVMNMNLPGVNPKVASFAWLLLRPMTSELGIVDAHILRALGRKESDMSVKEYYKLERMERAAKDASGYVHMPLGLFHWGLWDHVRNPGVHSDHSPLRVLDPTDWKDHDWDAATSNRTQFQAHPSFENARPHVEQAATDFNQEFGHLPLNAVPDSERVAEEPRKRPPSPFIIPYRHGGKISALPDFEDIRPYRIPFYLAPDGKFELGQPGEEHWEMPERSWFRSQYPDVSTSSLQGFVSFHPEFNKAGWPYDYATMKEAPWITDDMKQSVLDKARAVWDAYPREDEGDDKWLAKVAGLPNGADLGFQEGDRVELPNDGGFGTVTEVEPPVEEEDGTFTNWVHVKRDDGKGFVAADWMLHFVQGLEGGLMPDTLPPDWKTSADDGYWRTRVPFYLAPDGSFVVGNVGGEHEDIDDLDAVGSAIDDDARKFGQEWAKQQGIPWDENMMADMLAETWRDHQGQINFDPETGEHKAHWPINWDTMQPKEWITPEMQQQVIAEAQKRWQEQGPYREDHPMMDSIHGPHHLGKLSSMQVQVVNGDISQMPVDAIVNAANNELWMGSGVAGAIKQNGGQAIEDEAMAQGPIGLGEAVHTQAGNLPAQYVIHGAAMGRETGMKTTPELIAKTTLACLQKADELGCKSIALPLFGTGVGGFPMQESAQIMNQVVQSFQPKSLTNVVFAVYGDDAANAFTTSKAEWWDEDNWT